MGSSPKTFIRTHKTELIYALIGLAVTFFIITKGFRGTELGVGWVLLGIGFILSKKSIKNKLVFGGLLFLLGSVYLAVPGSLWWGKGNWEVTLYHAVWMSPFLLLYLINIQERIYFWLIPLLVLHSIVIISQGTFSRSIGLLDNPNPAGALLTIGAVFLLQTKYRWLVPLVLLGLLFTGSRSALIALVVVVLVMYGVQFIRDKKVPIKPLLILTFGVIFLVGFLDAGGQLGRSSQAWTWSMIETGLDDFIIRLRVTDIPSIVPQGITHSWGLHSLVERVSVEFGILAAVVWIGITFYGLWRKPWFNKSWWILFTIALLSVSEYSIWLGPLAALWWLTISVRTNQDKN